jgi:hypothetical protein
MVCVAVRSIAAAGFVQTTVILGHDRALFFRGFGLLLCLHSGGMKFD